MALRVELVEGLFEFEVKPWNEIFGMTSYLGLVRNFSGLDLAARFNHIYADYVIAVITKCQYNICLVRTYLGSNFINRDLDIEGEKLSFMLLEAEINPILKEQD